jgi:hypothetical protein
MDTMSGDTILMRQREGTLHRQRMKVEELKHDGA